MNADEKKAWEELVEHARQGVVWRWIDQERRTILAAAAVIERAGDVKTLTDKLFANGYPVTLDRCRVISKYLSRWLMEGPTAP